MPRSVPGYAPDDRGSAGLAFGRGSGGRLPNRDTKQRASRSLAPLPERVQVDPSNAADAADPYRAEGDRRPERRKRGVVGELDDAVDEICRAIDSHEPVLDREPRRIVDEQR